MPKAKVPSKRDRAKLAKSELWLNLAMSAQRWADTIRAAERTRIKIEAGGVCEGGDTPTMAHWGLNDPLNVLMKLYDLNAEDLAKLCGQIANEVENKALRSGYEDRWDEQP